MPPKAGQKAKVVEQSSSKAKAKPKPKQESESGSGESESESESQTPPPTSKAATAAKSNTKTTPKKPIAKPATQVTPRKKKEPPVYKRVTPETGAPVQIDVKFEGDSPQSPQVADGIYGHTLKLQATGPFKLVKTIKFTDGPMEGCEAIIIQPAKPFPFLKLPEEARAKIYTYYFANNRIINQHIPVEGKRPNKDGYAKSYAEGSRHRVGLLAVNKEIHDEAVQILYDKTMRFENTATVLDFWGQLQPVIRSRIRRVSIKTFVKANARNAMHFLAESPDLVLLHLESGIYTGEDTAKAAKEFYDISYKFLEAVGARKGDKTAGVDVLSFGVDAFTFKAGQDKKKAVWDEEKKEEFLEALKAKLN